MLASSACLVPPSYNMAVVRRVAGPPLASVWRRSASRLSLSRSAMSMKSPLSIFLT